MTGGLGLASLRPVLYSALAARDCYGRVVLIAGARNPSELLFGDELASWQAAADGKSIELHQSVDQAEDGWRRPVGPVTEQLAGLELEPDRTVAFLCRPEPMMQRSADLLIGRGLSADPIRISLERNMKCGAGSCEHGQLGPLLLRQHGPVLDYRRAGPLLSVTQP